jgi:hypothetical protein
LDCFPLSRNVNNGEPRLGQLHTTKQKIIDNFKLNNFGTMSKTNKTKREALACGEVEVD